MSKQQTDKVKPYVNKNKPINKKQHKSKATNIQIAPGPKNELTHLPTMQQLLAIPKQERLNKSSAVFERVKPFLTSFMQKKQGSRVTQLLFKWGNPSVKTIIFKEILKSWKDLIKSKYALYIIAKVSKQFELPGLVEDFSLLQNNREGAQILQNFIQNNPGSEIVKKLKEKINSFQLKAKEGDIKSQEHLDNMAFKSVEKQYYWFTLSKIVLKLRINTMFEEEKLKVIEHLVQNVSSIVNDEDGVRLFIELVNNCGSKDKKNLIKQYKGYLSQVVKANNVSYVSVIKLLTEVDDTVLVNKSFSEELVQLIPQILTCKKAFSLIFSLFSPRNNNFNILGKYEPHLGTTTCKKPEEARKAEIRQPLYEPLMEFLKIEENLALISKCQIESKLILGIYKSMEEDHHTEYKTFLTYLLKYYLNKSIQELREGNFANSIIADINASKIIKSILLLQEDFVETYCEQFGRLFTRNAKVVLETKASFILLGIIEKGGREHLAKELLKSGVKLDKAVAGPHFLKIINGLKK